MSKPGWASRGKITRVPTSFPLLCSVSNGTVTALHVDETNAPGGSSHVYGETPEGVDKEAVVVSGRHLLARVEITFSDALDKGVKCLAVYLIRVT